MSGKQTAVEWLAEVYSEQGRIFLTQFEQAIAMEREQIEDAYCNGVIEGVGEVLNRDTIKPAALKYYEDNHGKEAKPCTCTPDETTGATQFPGEVFKCNICGKETKL